MMNAMQDEQVSNVPVAIFLKKEAEKAVDVDLRRKAQCRKFLDAAYSTLL